MERVREIIERRLPLALSDDARQRIVRCREYLDRKMEHSDRPIYGITTGFGSLCSSSSATWSCRTPAARASVSPRRSCG